MESIGIPFQERRLIKNIYWNQMAEIKVHDEISEKIYVRRGVRQGSILSPTLFNLYSERIINEALDEEEGITINGHSITTIRYADDTVVLAKSEADLQRMMNELVLTSNMYGMDINEKKTKVLLVKK